MIKGIDVSHHNGAVDWHAVKASGRAFAFCKATEGAGYADPTFAHNRASALSAGVLVGGYHFYKFDDEWSDQAHHFKTVIAELRPGELPPVIDIEDRAGIAGKDLPAMQRKLQAFINAINASLKTRVIVYADRDFVRTYLQLSTLAHSPLWIAAYTPSMPQAVPPWGKPAFWQYAEHGACPGVSGECDLDLWTGDLPGLQAMAVKAVV